MMMMMMKCVGGGVGMMAEMMGLRRWPLLVYVDQSPSTIIPPTSVPVSNLSSSGPEQNCENLDHTANSQDEVQTAPRSSEHQRTAGQLASISGSGLMKCTQCQYETSSRAQYKMHAMKHRPQKWQCAHCGLNFALLYVQLSQLSLLATLILRCRFAFGRWVYFYISPNSFVRGRETCLSISRMLPVATLNIKMFIWLLPVFFNDREITFAQLPNLYTYCSNPMQKLYSNCG